MEEVKEGGREGGMKGRGRDGRRENVPNTQSIYLLL